MAKALGVSFDYDYYFDPDRRYAIDCECNEYATAEFPGMRLFYSESNLGQIDYWSKNLIHIGGIQPNMILGMLLGADFIPNDGYDADITPGCLSGKNPDDLPTPESLLEHELVVLFDEQIRKVQDDLKMHLRPIPPFFWDISGQATIHGMMTSAQKFLGEVFFMDMITEPQQCMEIMNWICDAFIVLCQHYSSIADLPITSVHVGECSACMVSPELTEKFVVPVTSKIGEQLGPVRLHSCGPSTNHLEAFSKITNLHSLDLGGDTSIKRIRQIFGRDMLISVSPLPHEMSDENTDPIIGWANRIIEENDGGNLAYVYHVEENYNVDTIRTLTDFVKNIRV